MKWKRWWNENLYFDYYNSNFIFLFILFLEIFFSFLSFFNIIINFIVIFFLDFLYNLSIFFFLFWIFISIFSINFKIFFIIMIIFSFNINLFSIFWIFLLFNNILRFFNSSFRMIFSARNHFAIEINQGIYLHMEFWRNSLINSKFFNVIFAEYKTSISIEKSFMKIFSKEFIISIYIKKIIINWIIDLRILLNILKRFIE